MITPNFHDCKCSSVPEACGCERDCLYQEYLVENGFVISCDCCGHAGHADSDGWIGVVDDQGRCAVFCSKTCVGEENYKIWEAAQEND